MKVRARRLIILSAVVITATLVGLWVVSMFFGGRRDLSTRIATRKLNTGAAATTAPIAEDWPRYRGPRGDGISRESGIAESLPGGAWPQLWAADVGLGYSSPIAAAGRVYLFSLNNSKETLTAFDAGTGQILWSDEDNGGWAKSYPGTRATPAIDGESIYTYGGSGNLIRRDLATGAKRWTVNSLNVTGTSNLGWGVSSSPLVAGNLVYVQAGKGGPIAIAVDKQTGGVAWQSEFRGTGGYAQPLLISVGGQVQLVIFCGDAVIGMTADAGKTLWSLPWKTDYDVNAAVPAYREPHLFVSSDYGHGCMMIRVAPGGAEKLWEHKLIACKINAPVLDEGDGHLYANSAGTITCMSWPDGAIKWSASESELRLGEGGSVIRVAPDKLLAMSQRGKASLLQATAAGYKVLWHSPTVDGTEVFSTPVLYGRRLYAKGTRELICFDLASSTPASAPSAGR